MWCGPAPTRYYGYRINSHNIYVRTYAKVPCSTNNIPAASAVVMNKPIQVWRFMF